MGSGVVALLEGLGCPAEHHTAGVEVDGSVGDAVELELLVHDALAVLDEETFANSSELLHTLSNGY